MLRYLERVGLIEPARTASGYRIFGPGELQRLRTLRELLARVSKRRSGAGSRRSPKNPRRSTRATGSAGSRRSTNTW